MKWDPRLSWVDTPGITDQGARELARAGRHQELATAYARLAVKLAAAYSRTQAWVDMEELVGVAMLRLTEVARRFDPDGPMEFRHFAAKNMRSRIMRAISKARRAVQVDRSMNVDLAAAPEPAADLGRLLDDAVAEGILTEDEAGTVRLCAAGEEPTRTARARAARAKLEAWLCSQRSR
ncbi:MAG: hypothetical protein L0Y64_26330, partial [Myxococcaceae bacterium]|nr:hypothetical protein [Myxococcaceae bacterium]